MMGRVSRCRAAVSCLLVPVFLDLTGCSTWQQMHALSEPVAAQNRFTQVRAHRVDGSVVFLHDPWVAGDTLYGQAEAQAQPSNAKPELYGRSQAPRDPSTKHSAAIPIAQIESLEAWQHGSGKTAAFVVGMTLAVKQVRAHLADGSTVVLNDPWFAGDTLYGRTEAKPQPSNAKPELYGRSQAPQDPPSTMRDSTGIPVAQLAGLEARQLSPGRTVMNVLGMTLAVVIVVGNILF